MKRYSYSVLFSVVLCISMILPVKAGDNWPYYLTSGVVGGVILGAGGAIVVLGGIDHTSEKLTNDVEKNAENFVKFLVGEKQVEDFVESLPVENDPNTKAEDDELAITKNTEQVSPLEKVSEIFKNTVESTGNQVAFDFSQHIEQSGHQLTVDLAQNVGRMMLSYTLGLFGAFFAYKQIVDYFAYQEKIDHLDMAVQEQKMSLLPQGNLAFCLQKREAALIAVKRKQLEQQQSRKFYLAGCGTFTFAAACGLCSYWIQ